MVFSFTKIGTFVVRTLSNGTEDSLQNRLSRVKEVAFRSKKHIDNVEYRSLASTQLGNKSHHSLWFCWDCLLVLCVILSDSVCDRLSDSLGNSLVIMWESKCTQLAYLTSCFWQLTPSMLRTILSFLLLSSALPIQSVQPLQAPFQSCTGVINLFSYQCHLLCHLADMMSLYSQRDIIESTNDILEFVFGTSLKFGEWILIFHFSVSTVSIKSSIQ